MLKILSITLITLGLLTACNQNFVRGDALLYEINVNKIPLYNSKHRFRLVNAFESPRLVSFGTHDRAGRGDLRQLSATGIRLIEQALGKRDVKVLPVGEKKIRIHIHHIRSHVGHWVRRTTLKLDAKLDNGEVIVVTASYRSPGDSFRAINGTIRRAVEQLLRHEVFVDYINS